MLREGGHKGSRRVIQLKAHTDFHRFKACKKDRSQTICVGLLKGQKQSDCLQAVHKSRQAAQQHKRACALEVAAVGDAVAVR